MGADAEAPEARRVSRLCAGSAGLWALAGEPQDGDFSIGGEEKFVYDFIQSLGLQKTDIGGWSMGGWIVLRLALDHPEMFDRVVVYDP